MLIIGIMLSMSQAKSIAQNYRMLETKNLREEVRNVGTDVIEKSYYDTENHLVRILNYNEQGNLVPNQLGIAAYEYKYDNKGKQTEQRFYDTSLNLYKPTIEGPSVIKYLYDDENNKMSVEYYNSNEQLLSNDVAVVQTEYDKQGRLVEERYFDNNKQLLDSRACIIRYKYDKKDRLVEERYYNKMDQLSYRLGDGSNEDYAIKQYVYNNNNRLSEKIYLDEKEEPMKTGASRIVYVYADNGKMLEKIKYNAAGKVIDKNFTNRPN